MGKKIQVGDKFGHWLVVGDCVRDTNSYHKKYLCECDCKDKTRKYVDEQNLKRGLSLSCGCVTRAKAAQRFTRHGMTKTKLFITWSSMINRCYCQTNSRYKDYGGRGIVVCSEWKSDFMKFYEWAMANGYQENLTIDRIDVNGNYCPENCRWATNKEQCNNRRTNVKITYKNETHNLSEWAEITGINRQTISDRLRKGYPLEDVFFCGNFPVGKRRIV